MKKNLSHLLQQLEKSRLVSDEQSIVRLNDALSKSLTKGGYDVHNHVCCQGNNSSCSNYICCPNASNTSCYNQSCF